MNDFRLRELTLRSSARETNCLINVTYVLHPTRPQPGLSYSTTLHNTLARRVDRICPRSEQSRVGTWYLTMLINPDPSSGVAAGFELNLLMPPA